MPAPDISLTHYSSQALTELFEKFGVFFAFSDKQLAEQAKEGVKYVSMRDGMICPKENAHEVVVGLGKIAKEAIEARMRDHSKEDIIAYELSNYECYYTYDIDDAVAALADHGYSREEIQEVFEKNRHLQEA